MANSAGGVSPQVVRALVVDTDQDLIQLASRLLRSRGIDVRQADRGLHALSMIRADPPDLLILGARLPEVHGFEVAAKIRANARYRRIPIIIVSSVFRGWRIAEDLKEAGLADAFLEKPFKLSALWNTVEKVLSQRPSGRGRRRRMAASAYQMYRSATQKAQAGDTQGAIECLHEALQVDPLSPKLHFHLGVQYLGRKGMTYQAMEAFEEVIRLDAEFFSALRILGVLYQRKGFTNKAVEMWERAMRCSPDDETAERMRVHLLKLL